MYFVSYFFPFITVIFIIVTMTNLLQSSCIMLNKILSSVEMFYTKQQVSLLIKRIGNNLYKANNIVPALCSIYL